MRSHLILFSTMLCSIAYSDMKSSQKANSADQKGGCKEGLEHIRLSARYTTPKGIGYKQGYSTLEGFFAPRTPFRGTWLPFLDLRGHIFDNGKFAANAGMGLRYLSKSRIWGINSYYDYRNTSRQHYNQVSAGLETLEKSGISGLMAIYLSGGRTVHGFTPALIPSKDIECCSDDQGNFP